MSFSFKTTHKYIVIWKRWKDNLWRRYLWKKNLWKRELVCNGLLFEKERYNEETKRQRQLIHIKSQSKNRLYNLRIWDYTSWIYAVKRTLWILWSHSENKTKPTGKQAGREHVVPRRNLLIVSRVRTVNYRSPTMPFYQWKQRFFIVFFEIVSHKPIFGGIKLRTDGVLLLHIRHSSHSSFYRFLHTFLYI